MQDMKSNPSLSQLFQNPKFLSLHSLQLPSVQPHLVASFLPSFHTGLSPHPIPHSLECLTVPFALPSILPSPSIQVSSSQPCVSLQEVPKGQAVEDMVGRPLVHVSAAKQTSGEAVYCDDIPHYENELYLTLVTSTKAHAKIL